MELSNFSFEATINGMQKHFSLLVPIENGNVITNQYCPDELLNGGWPFIPAINGESINDFINDCNKQISAMSNITGGKDIIDVHIAGLMASILLHINKCKRLIFGDLLIYMDCFSYLLAAEKVPNNEIKKIYPRIIRTIVDLYPEYIKNSIDLSPFKGSFFDYQLSKLSEK